MDAAQDLRQEEEVVVYVGFTEGSTQSAEICRCECTSTLSLVAFRTLHARQYSANVQSETVSANFGKIRF